MELAFLLGILCAGLSYFIVRDRAPDKVLLGTCLGLILGPLGVGLSFLLKPGPEINEAKKVGTSEFGNLSDEEQHQKISEVLSGTKPSKTLDELKADLNRMKSDLDKK